MWPDAFELCEDDDLPLWDESNGFRLAYGAGWWNPRYEGGYALRLVVKLRLAVNHYGEGTSVMLPNLSPDGYCTSPAIVEDNNGDPFAAACRAIVRAAAAMAPDS